MGSYNNTNRNILSQRSKYDFGHMGIDVSIIEDFIYVTSKYGEWF